MAHREGIRAFLKDVDLSDKVVHDWGCGQKPIINYLPHEGVQYTGLDISIEISEGGDIGANNVLFRKEDICSLVVLPKPADIAFCLEVLEHVENPDAALKNIANNLKSGCPLYVSVPFMYPIHSTHDLWRFTDQGLRLLLERNRFVVEKIVATEKYTAFNGEEAQAGWVAKARCL